MPDVRIKKLNFSVEKQKSIPVIYKEIKINCGYRIDMMVENRGLLELKAIESITNVHIAQILTYRRFAYVTIGRLINFKLTRLKDGIKRFVI